MLAGQDQEHLLDDSVTIELAEAALAGGWAVAARTAEVTAHLMARRDGPRGEADSIAFMANEIIENAVKFRVPGAGPVTITARQSGRTLHFHVRNMAPPGASMALAQLREDMASKDAGTLLIERIEANALMSRDEGSGLGVLTLMSDYGATIDWEVEPSDLDGMAAVTTRVSLPLD